MRKVILGLVAAGLGAAAVSAPALAQQEQFVPALVYRTGPYAPNGVTYSAVAKAFFIWRNDCGDRVLSNAVMSAGFDYAM